MYKRQDLNCAETILYAANEKYGWNLSHDALLFSAGFGGGVGGQELLCGALTGGVMALGRLFVRARGHESDLNQRIIKEYFALFEKEMGSIDCAPLKETYRKEETGCQEVILASARALDQIIKKYLQEII